MRFTPNRADILDTNWQDKGESRNYINKYKTSFWFFKFYEKKTSTEINNDSRYGVVGI